MTVRVIDARGLDALLIALMDEGFEVVGPSVQDQAIAHGPISSTEDLPVGITDTQEGGHYRLASRDDNAFFGYNVGPHSWKQYLYPSRSEIFRASETEDGIRFEATMSTSPKYAFFGVRPCDLAAISVQDKVFMGSGAVDPTYAANREDLFIVAVNCVEAGSTCFCHSMGTGPKASSGYDIVITEVSPGREFVADSGSSRGKGILEGLPGSDATPENLEQVRAGIESAVLGMGRSLDTDGIRELLVENLEHPRWDEVAGRCLTCGNCTMACPTCFCSTTEDTVTFSGTAIRSRRWDSCFDLDFSSLHGQPVRGSAKSRYRQWMTHKLSTWYDQFGTSGCVGCGRCITWCPVGIDITEETAAIREQVMT